MKKSDDSDRSSGSQTDDNVLNLISSARTSLLNGDFEKAEEDLHLGLAISGNTKNSTHVPYIYDILSAMAFSKGNLEKAVNILEEAMKELIILGFPENHHHVTDFRFRLGRVFSSFTKCEIAESGFTNSLEELKKNVDFGSGSQDCRLLYSDLLFRYGLYKVRNTEYLEAKQIINQALENFKFDVAPQPRFLKFISYTLSDLENEIKKDNDAIVNFADTLPFLRVPETPKPSKQRSSISKENTLKK
ncbi:hypothetical protein HHI36_009447 [Cryptolaemus montrouzieri]|uniref:Uncharacterized protein n=1 Tax=Cryptolaemus montrouzieri TaxID=559131 RepID=A0ABD2MFN2_9CUCU